MGGRTSLEDGAEGSLQHPRCQLHLQESTAVQAESLALFVDLGAVEVGAPEAAAAKLKLVLAHRGPLLFLTSGGIRIPVRLSYSSNSRSRSISSE